jgi:alpha-glucosidase (family GH31 glycosyl hydrolase)
MGQMLGGMRPLPKYAQNGLVLGLSGGQAYVESVLKKFKKAGVKLAAVHIEDWAGQQKLPEGVKPILDWELSLSHYPNWQKLKETLSTEGTRIFITVSPFFQRDTLSFSNALNEDCLLRDQTGEVYMFQ